MTTEKKIFRYPFSLNNSAANIVTDHLKILSGTVDCWIDDQRFFEGRPGFEVLALCHIDKPKARQSAKMSGLEFGYLRLL